MSEACARWAKTQQANPSRNKGAAIVCLLNKVVLICMNDSGFKEHYGMCCEKLKAKVTIRQFFAFSQELFCEA
jgi:hypothetical protein